MVIAEVNDRMPHVGGDNHIHVSELDYIVETSNPLFEIPLPKIGETEQAIGRYCAELIEDGSTLQLGIGAIPDARPAMPARQKRSGYSHGNVL